MWFYYHQLTKHGHSVAPPMAGCHISVVRDEEPTRKDLWKASVGRSVSFEYQPKLQTNGRHWWLLARSTELLDLRESFGLKRHLRHPLHITVAVHTAIDEVQKKKATKEVQARIEVLLSMMAALPAFAWESSEEKKELDTLYERFYDTGFD